MLSIKKCISTLLGLCLVMGVAEARMKPHPFGEEKILDVLDSQVELTARALYQDYRESDYNIPGSGLTSEPDREFGWVPGLGLTATKTVHSIYGRVNVEAYNGPTTYDGATQPVVIPITSTTHNFIFNGDVRLGRAFFPTRDISFIPYVLFGYQRWQRDAAGIEEVDGLEVNSATETYSNLLAGLGLLNQQALTSRLILVVDLNAGETFDSNMFSSFPNITGEIGGATLGGNDELGSRLFYSAGLGLNYLLIKDLFFTAKISYLQFKYGASSINAVGYFEPDSTTKRAVAAVGLSYSG